MADERTRDAPLFRTRDPASAGRSGGSRALEPRHAPTTARARVHGDRRGRGGHGSSSNTLRIVPDPTLAPRCWCVRANGTPTTTRRTFESGTSIYLPKLLSVSLPVSAATPCSPLSHRRAWRRRGLPGVVAGGARRTDRDRAQPAINEASTVDLKALEPYLEDLARPSVGTGRSLARLGQLLVVLHMLAPAFALPKPGQSLPATHPAVIAATGELDAAPEHPWTLAELAARVPVSPSYLCRLFMREARDQPLALSGATPSGGDRPAAPRGRPHYRRDQRHRGLDGHQLYGAAFSRRPRDVPQSLPGCFSAPFETRRRPGTTTLSRRTCHTAPPSLPRPRR